MTASYPGSIKTFTNKTDYVDDVVAADVNEAYDEITAIESELGADSAFVRTSYNNTLINGKFSVTVASGDLTLSLVSASGGTPSATNPVRARIGSEWRTATAAVSVTKAAGTNWGNLGGAELATNEVDLFVYLVWNTNLTPDAIDIMFARFPWGAVYSDFSATATDDKYGFVGATAPASTDDCALIGRFAATLSAGAGYTWSVPTFTNANLKQSPVQETRVLTYTAQDTGFTTSPAGYTRGANYQILNRNMKLLTIATAAGTSNTTGFTLTSPFPASRSAITPVLAADNAILAHSVCSAAANSNVLTLSYGASLTAASWTNSGDKYAYIDIFVPIG